MDSRWLRVIGAQWSPSVAVLSGTPTDAIKHTSLGINIPLARFTRLELPLRRGVSVNKKHRFDRGHRFAACLT